VGSSLRFLMYALLPLYRLFLMPSFTHRVGQQGTFHSQLTSKLLSRTKNSVTCLTICEDYDSNVPRLGTSRVSALGAVMVVYSLLSLAPLLISNLKAFLYSSYIITYAVLSVLLGNVVDDGFEENGNIVWALERIGGYVPLPRALP
jgi:hypothetical protein